MKNNKSDEEIKDLFDKYIKAKGRLRNMMTVVFFASGRVPCIDGTVLEEGEKVIRACFTEDELEIIDANKEYLDEESEKPEHQLQ